MRMTFKGRVTPARMREIADEVVAFLASYDIDEWCGMNIYLTPLEAGTNEHVELVDPTTGEEIAAVSFSNPNAVRRQRRSAQLLELVR